MLHHGFEDGPCNLKVIADMGDGGPGIGGALVFATCRRNINLSLLILKKFTDGMTGRQCASPGEARGGVR